jgi:protein subunit release factor B
MISQLWNITKTLVTLADDLQKFHSEIKEIRTELRNLTIAVSLLKQRIEHNEEMSQVEQKNLLLEIEKRLESANRLLPARKASKKGRRNLVERNNTAPIRDGTRMLPNRRLFACLVAHGLEIV